MANPRLEILLSSGYEEVPVLLPFAEELVPGCRTSNG